MDYLKNAERHVVDGRQISFIRCDKFGNEIPTEKLKAMNFTNSTIDKIVTDVAERISAEAPTADGIYTAGFLTE